MLGIGLGLTARAGQMAGGAPPGSGGTLVFALLGQSNMVGRVAFDQGSVHPEGVQQWGRTGAADGFVVPATVPLDHVDPISGDMGLDISLAENLAALNPGAELIFVPSADGGTAFQSGEWRTGGVRYLDAVARSNAAIAALPGATFAGILWHQGESDAGNPDFQADLDTLIAGLRQDITTAEPTTPFVLGGMVPGWVAVDPARQAIQAILEDTPARHLHIGFAAADDLTGAGTDVHFTASDLRTLGARYAAAWQTAMAPMTIGQIPDKTDQQDMAAPQTIAPIPDQQDTLT